jgi:hypothetical protein
VAAVRRAAARMARLGRQPLLLAVLVALAAQLPTTVR